MEFIYMSYRFLAKMVYKRQKSRIRGGASEYKTTRMGG